MSSIELKRKMTDFELCVELAPEAVDSYRRALDVMTAYPDYAKTKFRIVAEHLINTLGDHYKVDLNSLDLNRRIQRLHEEQIIDHSLSSALHLIRKSGNEVVHSNNKRRHQGDHTSKSSEELRAGDVQSAIRARIDLVGIFESIFLLLKKGEPLPEITMVEVGDLTSQRTLWKAISTMDFEAKMAAGLILEAQSWAPLRMEALLVEHSEDVHKKTTTKMAAELYWAACVISAELDSFNYNEIERMGGEEACIFKYANTEALFRFAQLTFDQPEGEERHRLGLLALEVAAKRGFATACGWYGNYLRENGQFVESFAFLSRAADQGDASGYSGLGLLHLEKDYCKYSQETAEKFFLDGINLGSSDCEYILGRYLYDGKELKHDIVRGKALLKSAMDAGHGLARQYNQLFVDETLVNSMHAANLSMMLSMPKLPSTQKQKRNELCMCGSGKKYKRCCGA